MCTQSSRRNIRSNVRSCKVDVFVSRDATTTAASKSTNGEKHIMMKLDTI